LLPAQESAEFLWIRLRNLGDRSDQLEQEYYRVSTLYGIGRVLAFRSMLYTEGVFVVLEDIKPKQHFGQKVREAFEAFDDTLRGRDCTEEKKNCFHRYLRVSLGEGLLTRVQSTSTNATIPMRPIIHYYSEFESILDKSNKAFDPALNFIKTRLDLSEESTRAENKQRISNMLDALRKIVCLMKDETNMPPLARGERPGISCEGNRLDQYSLREDQKR
jgi:hypothetical protein